MPRGHRSPRTALTSHTPGPTREQQLLDQMRGNPRVAYRIEHGALPHWMRVAEERRAQRERPPVRPDVPEAGPVSAEGGRHRRPRARRVRWSGRRALSYGAAVAGGVLLGQVVAMSPW
ncbi:hypothetical protein [Nocardiopsis tropica]|uniref:Uncharacterized protein n=1 Tax=Nocardiopsis tropica TaxID=109330 RepID=A0ABU7KUT2_9ACTN|nr:hypothetical protein [Nocardiopsis umidischolae]MEE2053029.1 hypothetical protein [Nocardiopsis umidischolae]